MNKQVSTETKKKSIKEILKPSGYKIVAISKNTGEELEPERLTDLVNRIAGADLSLEAKRVHIELNEETLITELEELAEEYTDEKFKFYNREIIELIQVFKQRHIIISTISRDLSITGDEHPDLRGFLHLYAKDVEKEAYAERAMRIAVEGQNYYLGQIRKKVGL